MCSEKNQTSFLICGQENHISPFNVAGRPTDGQTDICNYREASLIISTNSRGSRLEYDVITFFTTLTVVGCI